MFGFNYNFYFLFIIKMSFTFLKKDQILEFLDDSNLDFYDDMGNPIFVLRFSYYYESDNGELRDNEFHNGEAHLDDDQQNVLSTTHVMTII